MSISKERPTFDASPSEPIIGDVLMSVNHMTVIRRPVSKSQKTDAIVELAQIACQLWRLLDSAASLTLEFCSKSLDKNDILVFFTR